MILLSYLGVCHLMAQRILTQAKINSAKSVFVVKGNYDLAGKTITIPKNVKLVFKGGKIDNGILKGNDTKLAVNQEKPAFGIDITIQGRWLINEVFDKWFEFNSSSKFVSNGIIRNIFALSNDETPCHIHFDEERTYFFILPYNGRSDMWNIDPGKIVNGKLVRNYNIIYDEQYSSLRIFTIPSNTHVTINNTLKMLPTRAGAYFVFWEYDKENITVDGIGTILGDCKCHRYFKNKSGEFIYSGEWGMLFLFRKCRRIKIENITLSDAFGDCISFAGSPFQVGSGSREGRDLFLNNVKIKYARRNGIALGATNAVVKNCYFEGCGIDTIYGTAPCAAIDFESSFVKKYPGLGNRNVLVTHCTFKNNKHDISSTNNNLESYGRVSTTISDCIFPNPIRFNATYWIKFLNCRISSFTNWQNNITINTPFKNIEFENCEIDKIQTVIMSPSWKNTFKNCKIRQKIQ